MFRAIAKSEALWAIRYRVSGAAENALAVIMRPYVRWRDRRDGATVCISRFCYRMIAEPYLLHCHRHGPTCE